MEEPYETTELSVASYLAYSTDTMPVTTWDAPRRKCTFSFPDEEKCIVLLRIYQAGDARVEPREFWHTCNDVRRAMHDAKTLRAGR